MPAARRAPPLVSALLGALVVATPASAETPPSIWTTKPTRIDRSTETRQRIEAPAALPAEPREPIRGDFRVVDGATLAVDGRRLRLFGLVPIERERICDVAGTRRWACGIHARAALGALVAGRTLRCRTLAGDPAGESVVDCLWQERSISERLLAAGWADLDDAGRATPALAAARAEAEREGRGIWSRTGAPQDRP